MTVTILSTAITGATGKNAATIAMDRPRGKGDALIRVPGDNGQMCGPQNVVAVAIQENKAKPEIVMMGNGVLGATLSTKIVHVIKAHPVFNFFFT